MANHISEISIIRPSSLDFMCSTPNSQDRNVKRRRMGSSTCIRCDYSINLVEDSYYSCSVCTMDYCLKCTGISSSMLKALEEDSNGNFMWTCRGCKQNFPSINNVSTSLANLDKKNDKRLDLLEKKIDNLDVSINKKIKDEVQVLKEDVLEELSGNFMDRLKMEVRSEVREIDDQKSRMLNLVVFNLPESPKPSSEEKKRDDLNHFACICRSIGIEEVEVRLAFRLGNKKDDVIRPLKVILENKKTRRDILNNTKQIANNVPELLKRVVIVKDLTPKQRELNKKRRANKPRESDFNRNIGQRRVSFHEERTLRDQHQAQEAHSEQSRVHETPHESHQTSEFMETETSRSIIRSAYEDDTVVDSTVIHAAELPQLRMAADTGGSATRKK